MPEHEPSADEVELPKDPDDDDSVDYPDAETEALDEPPEQEGDDRETETGLD